LDQELLSYLQGFLTERRRHLFKKVLSERTLHITVAVEDVYQLHNTSAVIRSCDAFGIQELHVIEEVNVKRIDRDIVATSPHTKAYPLENVRVEEKLALFFGRETEGLSPEVLEQADDFIYIPMQGFTESLNISVSAAIILQALSQKLRASQIHWELDMQTHFNLEMAWTKKMIKDVDRIIERFLEERK